METFVAIDIETANSNRQSVCEVGLARFENGELVASWSSIVRPASSNSLDPVNFSVHGISQKEINEARELNEVWPEIVTFLDSAVLVAHNATQDLNKLFASLVSSDSNPVSSSKLDANFVCTLTVARNSPIEFEDYRLETICRHFDIAHLNPMRGGAAAHSAAQDAIAAGKILVEMVLESGAKGVKHLLDGLNLRYGVIETGLVTRGCTSKFGSSRWANATPNSEEFEQIRLELESNNMVWVGHPLEGKSICLTLSLKRLSEAEFVIACAMAGVRFKTSVSSKLDILVEGTDTTGKYEKGTTSKSVKARTLNKAGQNIRVVDEEEFLSWLGSDLLHQIDQIQRERVAQKKPSVIHEDPLHRERLDKQNQANDRLRQEGEALRSQFLTNPKWSTRRVVAGDRISFTQIFDLAYELELEEIARMLGIDVSKSVSGKLALLIVEDSGAAESAKLRDALLKGIEVTSLDTFLGANSEFRRANRTVE